MTTDLRTPCYTHAEHSKACAEAARQRRPFKQYVQVNYHGATQCALIVDAWDTQDDKSMWKVEMQGDVKGILSFPVAQVRKCSGHDDRCQCAREKRALF